MSDTVVEYTGGLRCRAEHAESGAVVVTDAPKDNHGLGESFSPSEMLSVSLGSCVLSIMGITARSLDLDIAGATATVHKVMANSPRRISSIAVKVHVPNEITAEQARLLAAAAHACPVHSVLKPEIDAGINFTWGSRP
jgi:putative redox protein